MLLLKLSHFKSGAAVISPEKRGSQTHSARAAAPADAGALAVFDSKPLYVPGHRFHASAERFDVNML